MCQHSDRQYRSGFTLAEMIIAITIIGFVSIGLAQFMIDTARTGFITTEKLEINADVRQFTGEMAEYARASNHFFIYRSIVSSDINDAGDRLRDGEHGDLLCLIYQKPWPAIDSDVHYTKIIIYARVADPSDPDSEGPVVRYEREYFDPSSSAVLSGVALPYPSTKNTSPEELISEILENTSPRLILELSRGLADGQLFYNYLDRSIMIKAEIIHGNDAKRITDTYNYTVSPRG